MALTTRLPKVREHREHFNERTRICYHQAPPWVRVVAHGGDAGEAKPHLEHNPLALLGTCHAMPLRKLNDPVPGAHAFRLEHHAPWLCPGACRRAELVIEPAAGRRRLAMSPGQGDPLVMEMTRGLDGGRSVAEQDGVARETKDTIRPAVGSDHVDALGSSKMT